MNRLRELRLRAEQAPAVELRPDEPHVAGLAIGLGSVVAGIWAARNGAVWVGWMALAGVVACMVLVQRWRVPGPGWRVDFERRSVEPVGHAGERFDVRGTGWTLRTAPGDKFGLVAIDLLHADRGRVARLYQGMVLMRMQRRQLFALADALSTRLGVARVDLQIGRAHV